MSRLAEAVILAIVQGLTEFLPISSSGHLMLIKNLFSIEMENTVAFVVLLHIASALAVVGYARREIMSLLTRRGRPLLFLLIFGTIPAALLGATLNDWVEGLFADNLLVVGLGLWFTAGVLFSADRVRPGTLDYERFGVPRVIGIGFAQAIAMVPGISRSGSTICAAMALGMKREEAVRFSFLLAVPIIMGAGAKKLLDIESAANFVTVENGVAFVVCLGVSLGALQLLVSLVRNKKLSYFSVYCAVVGLVSIVWHFARV